MRKRSIALVQVLAALAFLSACVSSEGVVMAIECEGGRGLEGSSWGTDEENLLLGIEMEQSSRRLVGLDSRGLPIYMPSINEAQIGVRSIDGGWQIGQWEDGIVEEVRKDIYFEEFGGDARLFTENEPVRVCLGERFVYVPER